MSARIHKIKINWLIGTWKEDAIKVAEEVARRYHCEVEFDFNGEMWSGGYKLVEQPRYALEFVEFEECEKDE